MSFMYIDYSSITLQYSTLQRYPYYIFIDNVNKHVSINLLFLNVEINESVTIIIFNE